MGATGANPGGALLCYVPDALRAVRTGRACAIDRCPASAGKPWSAGISGVGAASRPTPGRSRCGNHDTPESRCCCYGCRTRCRCGWQRDSCSDCCSRNRRATHGTGFRPPHRLTPAFPVWSTGAMVAQKCGRRCAPPSGQRLSDSAPSEAASRGSMGEPRHTRKPMSLPRASGARLRRPAARQKSGSKLQAPPRSTR